MKAAEKAGQQLQTMVPAISKTATLVSEITSSSEEQSVGVKQVRTAISELEKLARELDDLMQQLSASAFEDNQ